MNDETRDLLIAALDRAVALVKVEILRDFKSREPDRHYCHCLFPRPVPLKAAFISRTGQSMLPGDCAECRKPVEGCGAGPVYYDAHGRYDQHAPRWACSCGAVNIPAWRKECEGCRRPGTDWLTRDVHDEDTGAYVRSDSRARHEFEKLLRAMHALEQTGDDLGNEADTLREAMEEPWFAMSEAERRAMRTLSASLLDYPLAAPWACDCADGHRLVHEPGEGLDVREQCRPKPANGIEKCTGCCPHKA